MDQDTLDRLAHHHLEVGEAESRTAVCVNLESVLRSPKHVRETIYNLQPPSFRMLERMIDAEGYALPLDSLKESVIAETLDLARRVGSGQILGRDNGLVVYRRVLLEARRNELELDASEAALLGVLRRELKIRQVEHFLIEHHEDFHPLWNADHAFIGALNGLRSSGLAYISGSLLRFPEDLVPLARQVLGLEAGAAARKRLFERLTGADASGALEAASLRTSGTKEEKIQRLVDNYVQPTEVLTLVPLATLREMCREVELATGGSKDELVTRLVRFFALGYDIRPKPTDPPPPPPEPRHLSPPSFEALFASFRGQDLSDILSGIGASRMTGSKEQLVQLLQESRFSEASLMMELDSKQLDAALVKHRLRAGGSKREKTQRLLELFSRPLADHPNE
ncbi:SAP domain-containing protein [Corallococcus terminator]|uniref:SAP domain-containing protein n=1 Tax=Corallococcus terminator TaxID=2316733 RepID=UPI0011C48E41|nr:SAP domain-containing protein [Corallococcus terminator]